MPRPSKCRRVAYMPEVTYFKPAGIPLRDLEEVRMSIEEAEAVRLKDLEGTGAGAGGRKDECLASDFPAGPGIGTTKDS